MMKEPKISADSSTVGGTGTTIGGTGAGYEGVDGWVFT